MICNLLVIVTFAYRVCSNETCDLDQSFTSPELLSSVIITQGPFSTNAGTSLSLEEANSRQITREQTETSKSKMENAGVLYAEEGA